MVLPVQTILSKHDDTGQFLPKTKNHVTNSLLYCQACHPF